MLRIEQARVFPRALGFLLALTLIGAGSGAASAKARIKKAPTEIAPAEIAPPVSPSAQMTPPPVRFFTINAVLAKHDGLLRGKPGAMRMASADAASGLRGEVASDAHALAPVTSDEPFGLFTFRAPEGLLWVKWRGVKEKLTAEAEAIRGCAGDDDRCSGVERKFITMARAAGETEPRSRVEAINRAVNQSVRYVSDYQQHGVADLWSSPLETLRSGIGDCEDYAIAKYALLRAADFAEADLKLLLVRDLAVREDHAVLAVRLDGRWLVLDNRRSALLEGQDLQSFMPLFAIDHRGVSLFAAPYAERPHHESEMLPAADADSEGGQGRNLPLAF